MNSPVPHAGVNGKTADVVLPDYHNYTQLVAELEQLADSYTTTSQLYIQGSTVEGRQLAVIRISGEVQQVGNRLDLKGGCAALGRRK